MRKEIKFELYDHDHYQINVKNIFSDCLNQIEDRIKVFIFSYLEEQRILVL